MTAQGVMSSPLAHWPSIVPGILLAALSPSLSQTPQPQPQLDGSGSWSNDPALAPLMHYDQCWNDITEWERSGKNTQQDLCLAGGIFDARHDEMECPATDSYRDLCDEANGKICRVHYHGFVDGWADRCYPVHCSGKDLVTVAQDDRNLQVYDIDCDHEECEDCWTWILAFYGFIGGIFLLGYCIAAKVCAPKQLGWSTDIDDCFSDIGTCCMACWCPCINFGNIAAYAWDSSSSWIHVCCFVKC